MGGNGLCFARRGLVLLLRLSFLGQLVWKPKKGDVDLAMLGQEKVAATAFCFLTGLLGRLVCHVKFLFLSDSMVFVRIDSFGFAWVHLLYESK